MKEENKCLSCKWVYIGQYSETYKGRPIGCIRPDKKKGNCWEAEDKEDGSQRSDKGRKDDQR